MKIRIKFLKAWVDKKTGIPYARLRRAGQPEISLPTPVGSPEFWASYHAALRGETAPAIAAPRKASNCIELALAEYINDILPKRASKESTQKRQASTLRKWGTLPEIGSAAITTIDEDYINRVIAEADTPIIANTWLITVRPFFEWAKAKKMITVDPTLGITVTLPKSEGHYTWEEEDIAQFEARWPLGTLERLLFSLLLYTGQRCSDVLKLGPKRIINGAYKVKSKKTNVDVWVKLHPALVAAIDAYKVVGLRTDTYLHAKMGGPLKQRDLNKMFREACTAAGLDDKFVPHGLRKGFCRRLADLGYDPWKIAAMSGHLSIKEVMRYCEAYNRRKQAEAGMDGMIAAYPGRTA